MEEIKFGDLVLKGWKLNDKKVRKCTPTSGALYLHKSLIGKRFDVFLIPKDEVPQVEDEVKKLEESLKNNLKELKEN